MIVTCARCAARYVLAERLLGPAGARVRCPRCSERFVVTRPDGAPPPARRATDAVRPAGPDASADVELDALEVRLGPALAAAHTRGRLFAEHGPALLDAFEAYRRRSGRAGTAAAFRAALERRLGIRLAGRQRG